MYLMRLLAHQKNHGLGAENAPNICQAIESYVRRGALVADEGREHNGRFGEDVGDDDEDLLKGLLSQAQEYRAQAIKPQAEAKATVVEAQVKKLRQIEGKARAMADAIFNDAISDMNNYKDAREAWVKAAKAATVSTASKHAAVSVFGGGGGEAPAPAASSPQDSLGHGL
jgi:hypothetical protein